jgi:hypothetical protein
MTPYLTVSQANTLMLTVLNTAPWDGATNAEKLKALCTATRSIDNLNFLGDKTSETQELQFPRDSDTLVPEAIQLACCLLANRLLDGIDPEMEYENLRLVSQGYANVRSTYSPTSIPDHVTHGIVSVEAWRLLLPYLRSGRTIKMNRVS